MPEPLTMATALAGGEAIKTTADAVSVIGRLLGKLRRQPDIAALKLAAALEEISKTYTAVDEAFNSYVALAIDEDALRAGSKELLAIAGGSLGVLVADRKGDCAKIGNIYQAHLKRWFAAALNPTEATELHRAFDWLGMVDEDLFRGLIRVCDQLAIEAKQMLVLVTSQRYDEARIAGWATYDLVSPLKTEMAKTMRQMMDLKVQFIEIARAT